MSIYLTKASCSLDIIDINRLVKLFLYHYKELCMEYNLFHHLMELTYTDNFYNFHSI